MRYLGKVYKHYYDIGNIMNERYIASLFEEELPAIIKEIAMAHNIPEYAENPDFLDKRLIRWHQFGLLEHTRRVRKSFLKELPQILKSWSVDRKITVLLSERIGGIKKQHLLEMSIPFHDLGKIICLHDLQENRKHEFLSAAIVDFLSPRLKSAGLEDKGIAYIRRCVETHDIVGKEVRDKLTGGGHSSLEYLSGEGAGDICRTLPARYEDIKLEAGIYFICDTLGKVGMRIKAETDSEISKGEKQVIEYLAKNHLPEDLKLGIMQLPINLKVAELYMRNYL